MKAKGRDGGGFILKQKTFNTPILYKQELSEKPLKNTHISNFPRLKLWKVDTLPRETFQSTLPPTQCFAKSTRPSKTTQAISLFTQRIAKNTLTASEASETNAFAIFKRLCMIMLEIERLVMIPSPSIKYF